MNAVLNFEHVGLASVISDVGDQTSKWNLIHCVFLVVFAANCRGQSGV